jgi:hypothetical protein
MRTLYDDRERLIEDITKLSLADDSNKLQPTAETIQIEPGLLLLEFRQEPLFSSFQGEVEMIAVLQ